MLSILFLVPVAILPPTAQELSPVPKVEPRPNDPIVVEAGKYRFYSVQGYEGPVTWQTEGPAVGIKEAAKALTLFGVVSGQSDPGEYEIPAGAVIVWGRDEGTTKVAAWGVVEGKAKLLLTLVFQVGPRPPPKPDPNPVVTGKLAAALVIDETSDLWPTRGQTKLAFDQFCDSNSIGRRWVDKDVKDSAGQVPADLAPWLARAKNIPCIYLVTDKGGILFEGPAPKTAEAMKSLLSQYKGK